MLSRALSSNGSSNQFQRRTSTALALSCYDATNIKPFNNNDISQLCQKALLDGRGASMPQLMVVLKVTFTTSSQQDRLVQRELFDKKTSRVVPDYYDIEVDGFDGQVYGYWPAKVLFRQHAEPDRLSRSAREAFSPSRDIARLRNSIPQRVPRSEC